MGVVRGSIPRESILFAFGYVHPQFHCICGWCGLSFFYPAHGHHLLCWHDLYIFESKSKVYVYQLTPIRLYLHSNHTRAQIS
jgi:hypothetical protein